MKNKKIYALIQARMKSSRLPGKILKKINGKEAIVFMIDRLKKCKSISGTIILIPNGKSDDKLCNFLKKKGLNVFRGSENDVLDRYYKCAKSFNIDHILRLTSDCPFIDPELVDKIINTYKKGNYDYVSNIIFRSFPDGMDAEVFSLKALSHAWSNLFNSFDREHVTKYFIRSNYFKKKNIFFEKKNFQNIRLTLDYKEDLILLNKLTKKLSKDFNLKKIIEYYNKDKKIFNINKMFVKEIQSLKINSGQVKWSEAKKFIAGGNMLFSKRPDRFLPERWPAYFKKAKGCNVYDLDDKRYIDMTIMGVGTNILGYANSKVDNAVSKRIKKGNMTTLNCVEEVDLAKKLIKIHPWSSKVRFARSGGEANSIAIRLARASTKKQNIAFCGYHGWHDWYLATNLRSKKNLNDHLLDGLKIGGVSNKLRDTIYPFKYNDFKNLKKIVLKYNIGIIKMEVVRDDPPKNNFLKKVRKLADEKKIILIFDECTSGFRECLGGIHKKYKVEPDLLMLGKALGNGYPITAVLGTKNIMESINKTFISSTFWTDSSGPTAALKTLEIMEKTKSWDYITQLGAFIKENWRRLSIKHNLKVKISGINSLCKFNFISKNNQKYKTLITQEMLNKGILATNIVYVSVAHNKLIINKYLSELDRIFSIISKCENKNEDIFKYLIVPVAETDFARLN